MPPTKTIIGVGAGIAISLRLNCGWFRWPDSGLALGVRVRTQTLPPYLPPPPSRFSQERHLTSSDVIPAFAPSMVDVRLLGVVTVSVSGQLVTLTHNEQLLVAALFGIAGRPISAESLIERIWDGPPRRGALHELVSKLRKSLDAAYPGASAVVVTLPNGFYKANLEAVQVDVLRFQAHLDEAGHLDQQDELSLAAERYRQALDQWGGDLAEPDEPLAGLAGRRMAAVRHGLRTGHLNTLVRLIDIELRLGRRTQAIPLLDQLTTLHPYDEHISELQMRALCRAGQWTRALAVYRELEARLRTIPKGKPSERVQQLNQRILNRDKGLGPPMNDDQFTGATDQAASDPGPAGRSTTGRQRRPEEGAGVHVTVEGDVKSRGATTIGGGTALFFGVLDGDKDDDPERT